MKKYLKILMLLVFFTNFSHAQEQLYKTELDFGDGVIFTTFLDINISQNQYRITSLQNADARIFGGFKAKIGRLMGKLPKKGVLLKITASKKEDSLFGNTKLPIFGELKFKGFLTDNILSGQFVKNDSIVVGTLRGQKSTESSLNYDILYPKILEITQNNIYSERILQTKDWKKYQKKLKKLCNSVKDDVELFLGFNTISSTLPFSHYNLIIQNEDYIENNEDLKKTSNDEYHDVVFEEKNDNTAYIKIKNFSSSQKELAEVLPNIIKNYKNLIVDLRDNGGGGIDAAFEFAKYIVNEDTNVGYFVTNKLQYSGFNDSLFNTLPELQPLSTNEFGQYLKKNKGAQLIFKKPSNSVFTGNLYVLTNNKTGSTCEPIVYSIKNIFGATIIGEKTAGAMLAASPFNIYGKYIIMLPIADFYTYDGIRLDQNGVSPNIEVESEKALEKAMEIINNKAKKQ